MPPGRRPKNAAATAAGSPSATRNHGQPRRDVGGLARDRFDELPTRLWCLRRGSGVNRARALSLSKGRKKDEASSVAERGPRATSEPEDSSYLPEHQRQDLPRRVASSLPRLDHHSVRHLRRSRRIFHNLASQRPLRSKASEGRARLVEVGVIRLKRLRTP